MKNNVYHGSIRNDITELKAHTSTHRKKCIYATDNKAVAMMFAVRDRGDLDTIKSIENGVPVLVERRPGVLEECYNKPGYIYELPGETFEHYDYLWKPEVISFEEQITPKNVESYESILEELKKYSEKGLIKLYQYPSRPNDIPIDNSDLIDKYIDFQKRGIESAIPDLLKVYPHFKDRVIEKLTTVSDTRSFNANVKKRVLTPPKGNISFVMILIVILILIIVFGLIIFI